MLKTKLSNNNFVQCTLHDVLLIPELAYNLISVSKATGDGNKFKFSHNNCHIFDQSSELIGEAEKVGNL